MMTNKNKNNNQDQKTDKKKDEEDDDDEMIFGKRIRQYALDNNGPFVVHIRSMKNPLESRQLTQFIRNKYKSNIVMKQVNEFKIRVEFSEKVDSTTKQIVITKDEARMNANDLPTRVEWNRKYRIYIQEKDVEVIGCIKYGASQNVDELITVGEGKFRNPRLPAIKILEVSRFHKKTEDIGEDGSPDIIPTNDVRITFSGLIVPDFVNIDQLLIPVRKFHKKQMFCNSCQRYNHTEKFCNNQKCDNLPNAPKCIHCKLDTHHTGDKVCPRRQKLEKRESDNIKRLQKKTFAEMLKQYDPESTMPGENLRDHHFPLQLGTKRQRRQEKERTEQPSTSQESPKRKKAREENSSNETPPGFRNPNKEEWDLKQQIETFIMEMIEDMELPPFIRNIVETYIAPTIVKTIINFLNSLKGKFGMSQ